MDNFAVNTPLEVGPGCMQISAWQFTEGKDACWGSKCPTFCIPRAIAVRSTVLDRAD